MPCVLQFSDVGWLVGFQFSILLCFTFQARAVEIPDCILMSSPCFASLLNVFCVLDCEGDVLEGIHGLHSKWCGLSKLLSVFIIEVD